MNILTRFFTWLLGLLGGPRPYSVRSVEEVPDQLDPGTVYLIGEGQHTWFAVLQCPCGCNEILQLSLLPEGRPRWTVTHHADGTISLSPSIWRQVGCRSHFWLRRGYVEWCPTRPRY